MWGRYLGIYGVSVVCCLLVTPLMKRIARKYKIYDYPGYAKMQKEPVPYLGGVAIFIGCLIADIAGVVWFRLDISQLMGFFAGAFFIVLFGLLDDLKKVSPSNKFISMILAGFLLIYGGIKLEFMSLRWYNILLTIFYIVGLINAVNFLDGLDGLATGISGIAGFFFFVISIIQGNTLGIILSLSLLGVCLGFLIYNFSPASIFMGDAGSMFLGFNLAALVILFSPVKFDVVRIMAPLLVVGVPIVDTFSAIIRRLIKRSDVFTGDRGHTYDVLVSSGWSVKKTVVFFYVIGVILGCVAVLLN